MEPKPFKIISLDECAEELGKTARRTRELFQRLNFLPFLRIGEKAFYMRSDFEQLKREHEELNAHAPAHWVSVDYCARVLGIHANYMRTLFRNTRFIPVGERRKQSTHGVSSRTRRMRFYVLDEFEKWRLDYGWAST